jgi:uncharacterized OB-fold protein
MAMTMTGSGGAVQRGVFPAQLKSTLADSITQPFWDGAEQDRLVVQQCAQCATFRLPPAPMCWKCQSRESGWVELPGTGTVYAFTVVRHPLHRNLADVVPYVSSVVELDGTQGEGARLLVNIIDCDPDDIHIGTPVEIVFDHITDEMAVPRARPARAQGASA